MKERLLQVLPHVTALVVFVAISCIYFSPIFDGYQVRQGDIDTYMGMSKELRDLDMLTGEEALWTNSQFGGMPTDQISRQHPGNWLRKIEAVYRLWLPRPVGILFAAMLGFYILCQCLRVNAWLGIVGAVAFGLASWNFLYIGAGHMSKVNAVAYIAPALGGLFLVFRGRLLLGGALLAFFTGMQLAANHFQITYYLLFLFLFVGLGETVRLLRKGELKPWLRSAAVAVAAGLLGVLPNYSNITGTATYGEYSTRGTTELTITPDGVPVETDDGLDRDYILDYSFGEGEVWQVLIPNVKGGRGGLVASDPELAKSLELRKGDPGNYVLRYWGGQRASGGAFYYGAVVCLLFVLGMVLWQSVTRWFILALVLLCFGLSVKDAGGLTDFFLNNVPYFNKFRDTKMILVLVQLLFPLVGVLGLQALLFERDWSAWKMPVLITTGAFSTVALVLAMAPSAFFSFETDNDEAMHRAYLGQQVQMSVQQAFLSRQLQITSMEDYEREVNKRLDPLVEDVLIEVVPIRQAIFKADALRTLLFVLFGAALLALTVLGKLPRYGLMAALGLLIMVDLIGVDQRYLNNERNKSQYAHYISDLDRLVPQTPDAADLEIYEAEAPLAVGFDSTRTALLEAYRDRLDSKRDKKNDKVEHAAGFGALTLTTNYRVLKFNSAQGVSRGELTGDGRTPFFHKSISGYHGAKLKRFQELIDWHIEREMDAFTRDVGVLGLQGALNAMHVTNMLNVGYLVLPNDQNGQNQAVRNLFANGPAWFVEDVEVVRSADEEIEELGTTNTKTTALVDQRFESLVPESITPDSTAEIFMHRYSPNRISYFTEAASEQFAVFAEVFYPEGWEATIDGKPAEIVRTNYVLRGLTVPAGEHEVVFTYNPTDYASENTVSAIGSTLVILLLLAGLGMHVRGTLAEGQGGSTVHEVYED